jgi:hypothetical protein
MAYTTVGQTLPINTSTAIVCEAETGDARGLHNGGFITVDGDGVYRVSATCCVTGITAAAYTDLRLLNTDGTVYRGNGTYPGAAEGRFSFIISPTLLTLTNGAVIYAAIRSGDGKAGVANPLAQMDAWMLFERIQ